MGSPPPMRGKAQNGSKRRRVHRITPAYAGKRRVGTAYRNGTWGSPPPMRGKAGQPSKRIDGAGITPAYAGKSFSAEYAPHSCRDHPRLCGEKFTYTLRMSKVSGSPPPMRGKACASSLKNCTKRITPAYAGKRQLTPQNSTRN